MSSTRTDVHSPTNLVTEDYEFILVGDNSPVPGVPSWIMQYGDFGLETSRRIASSDKLGRSVWQCHHCGSRLRYFAVLAHVSGDYIVVGETCLENRFERATVDFQKTRKQAELDRGKQRIKGLIADFVSANPDLDFMQFGGHKNVDQYNETCPAGSLNNDFIADVSRKFAAYGELSERQVDAVRRALVRDDERAARTAAEPVEIKVPVVVGKVQITGKVLSTKWVENDFGGSLKMLVRDDRGFKVWGTVPAALIPNSDVNPVGQEVIFSATVEASRDDDSFGFFKRPTKASYIQGGN